MTALELVKTNERSFFQTKQFLFYQKVIGRPQVVRFGFQLITMKNKIVNWYSLFIPIWIFYLEMKSSPIL